MQLHSIFVQRNASKSKIRIDVLVYARPSQWLMAIDYSAVYRNRTLLTPHTHTHAKHVQQLCVLLSITPFLGWFFRLFCTYAVAAVRTARLWELLCSLHCSKHTHSVIDSALCEWLALLVFADLRTHAIFLFFYLFLWLCCRCCSVSRQQAVGGWFIFYQVSKKSNAVANARSIRLDRPVPVLVSNVFVVVSFLARIYTEFSQTGSANCSELFCVCVRSAHRS